MNNRQYIQKSIDILKTIPVLELRGMKAHGLKTITIKIENEGILNKDPAEAAIPLLWAIDCKERFDKSKDEKIFSGFVSDWISNWI